MFKKAVKLAFVLSLLVPQHVFALQDGLLPGERANTVIGAAAAPLYQQVFTQMKELTEENESNKRKFGDLNNFSSCSCHLQMKVTVPTARDDSTAAIGAVIDSLALAGSVINPATLLILPFTEYLYEGSEERSFGDNFYFFESQNRELFARGSGVTLFVDVQNELCGINGNGLEQYNEVGFLVQSCHFKKKGSCCCNMDEGEYDKKYYNCQYVVATPGTFNQICPGGGILPYDPNENGGKCSDKTVKIKDRPKGVSDVTLDINTLKQKTSALNMLGTTDPRAMVQRAIDLLMAFMGTILFALYIYAGFTWMLANGNDEKITSAKNILVWSTLGVAVMLGSYVIIKFIFFSLGV